MALISAFSAGFAVQGQLAEQKAEVIQGEIEELEARVDILKGKIKPATLLNAISSLASHDMATAVIYANSGQLLCWWNYHNIRDKGEASCGGNLGGQGLHWEEPIQAAVRR